MTDSRWSDQHVEQTIASLLRGGLLVATVLVTIGALVYLSRHGGQPTDYRLFDGEPADLRGLRVVFAIAIAAMGAQMIYGGLRGVP